MASDTTRTGTPRTIENRIVDIENKWRTQPRLPRREGSGEIALKENQIMPLRLGNPNQILGERPNYPRDAARQTNGRIRTDRAFEMRNVKAGAFDVRSVLLPPVAGARLRRALRYRYQ